MEDLLIEILQSFEYPVILQGSLLPSEKYPDDFFTFWSRDSGSKFLSNKEVAIYYTYDVNFYSTDPAKVYTVLRATVEKLREAGFIVSGDGHSVVSDEKTHDGRGIEVTYLHYK